MNDLQIFNYHDKPIRTIERNGEVWWVLKDVCGALGIVDHISVSKRLDEDEKGVGQIHPLGGRGGIQETTIINEPGLYNVILRSDKPEAKDFKRWVTHEVLPTIRRTGQYSMIPLQPRLTLPEGVSLSGLARLISITRRAMLDAGSTPLDVCGMIRETYQAVGFPVPSVFPQQLPGQTSLFDPPALA